MSNEIEEDVDWVIEFLGYAYVYSSDVLRCKFTLLKAYDINLYPHTYQSRFMY